MKQKFRKLTFVRVTDQMPPMMAHFPCGFAGIVDGTHSQIYGGNKTDIYSLFMLRDGRVVDRISWYNEDQLTALPEQNALRAEELIEEYNLRHSTRRVYEA